jgi:hypothetical protein
MALQPFFFTWHAGAARGPPRRAPRRHARSPRLSLAKLTLCGGTQSWTRETRRPPAGPRAPAAGAAPRARDAAGAAPRARPRAARDAAASAPL